MPDLDVDQLFKILHLADQEMQAQRLFDWIEKVPQQELVFIIDEVILHAIRGNLTARDLFKPQLFAQVIFRKVSSDIRREIHEVAVQCSLPLVAALFTDSSQKLKPPDVREFPVVDARHLLPSRKITEHKSSQELKKDPITLGERRAIAKKPIPKIIDKMLFDPDPQVVQYLLENPCVQETHVLRIVSRKPNFGEILTTVAEHPKWGKNIRVRRGLAMNPYTPTSFTVANLITMTHQDLKQIARNENLHFLIRSVAEMIQTFRNHDPTSDISSSS